MRAQAVVVIFLGLVSISSRVATSDPILDPPPRSEFFSNEKPTAEMVSRELARSYPDPKLHKVEARGRSDRPTVIAWIRFFDGVEMEGAAKSSNQGDRWITRFIPELTPPERPDRKKLITPAAAIRAAALPEKATAKLMYIPTIGRRQRANTKGNNAVDYFQVIESWRLGYVVNGFENSAFIDAYTGDVVRTWKNSIE